MLNTVKIYLPGFALAFIIGVLSTCLSKKIGVPTSLLALFIGIGVSFLYQRKTLQQGINFSSRFILRFGVAFLGFRIVFDDIFTLGWSTVFMISISIATTIFVGIITAKLLGLRKDFGALTGGAVSICGASAAIAITTVLPDHKDKERNLSFTIIGITAFSTAAMVLYPIIGHMLNLNPTDMALFLGGTIHDVAQTAGAGYAVSEEVGDLAILTKMIRVSFLLPVVVCFMLYLQTNSSDSGSKVPVPTFLFVFIAFIILNSLLTIPQEVTEKINIVSRQALITAIAAIGLKSNLRDILNVGLKPIVLIAIQTLTMAVIMITYITYL